MGKVKVFRSMAETLAAGRKGGGRGRQGTATADDAVTQWFVREILPLEAILVRYLRRNWRNASDITDLRQEIYTRIFDAARDRIPDDPERFLMVTARNLIINLVKHEQIVPIDAVADLEMLGIPTDAAGPERTVMARDELRRLRVALDRLPRRARQAFTLAFLEDLSAKEIAARMGVSTRAVSKHLTSGLRALTNMLYGETDGKS
jgi:RNA polymerase sigma factor (sigma-70 family)